MNIANRISKLEAKAMPGDDFKVFRVIGETGTGCNAQYDPIDDTDWNDPLRDQSGMAKWSRSSRSRSWPAIS
jgi:hypothetical protein